MSFVKAKTTVHFLQPAFHFDHDTLTCTTGLVNKIIGLNPIAANQDPNAIEVFVTSESLLAMTQDLTDPGKCSYSF